jgi:pSer/pThr/pTyr-binding forkhead associated (FHA) protein
MEAELNRRQLFFKGLAGFVGGALGWMPNELVMHGHRLGQAITISLVLGNYAGQAILAGLIGGLVLAVEPPVLVLTQQLKRRLVRAFIICAILSLFATYFSDRVFNSVLQWGGVAFSAQGEMLHGSIIVLITARVMGWAIEGALIGIGVGVASLVAGNVIKGALGGLLGGIVGGLSFDGIAAVTQGGLAARFFGFSAVGLAIGLFIGLVHELTKAAWLKVEQGRLRGREFLLEKALVNIGRAEENDVGLFGDPAVKPRHAQIMRQGDDFVLKDLSGSASIFVNGAATSTATLREADRIKIGNYELSFHLRKAATPAQVAAQTMRASAAPAQYAPAQPAPARPTPAVSASGSPRLIDESGREFPLRADIPTRLGRETQNEVVLMAASVSRYHAVVEPRNGAFFVRDLGSHNGTYVGGQRISEAQLHDGDVLGLGEVQLVFRA